MTDEHGPDTTKEIVAYNDGRVYDRTKGRWYSAQDARNTPEVWESLGPVGRRCVEQALGTHSTEHNLLKRRFVVGLRIHDPNANIEECALKLWGQAVRDRKIDLWYDTLPTVFDDAPSEAKIIGIQFSAITFLDHGWAIFPYLLAQDWHSIVGVSEEWQIAPVVLVETNEGGYLEACHWGFPGFSPPAGQSPDSPDPQEVTPDAS